MIETNLLQDVASLSQLPRDWRVLGFCEIVEDVSAGNKKLLKANLLQKGKIPVVDQGKELIAGFIDHVEDAVKTCPPHIVFGDHTRILKFIDFPFAMGADGTKVLKTNSLNDTKYLYYFLTSLKIPDTGYNRHFKYLKSAKIPLPPLEEQKKIAAILDAVDALRQKDKALIAKYDELTQALFSDMFGDSINNQKNWETVKFGSIFKSIRYGTSTPPVYQSDGIPFIRATNVKGGTVEIKGITYISEVEAAKIKKCKLKEGDLIIVRSGANTGDCCRIPKHYANSYGGFDLIIDIDDPYSVFYNFLLNSQSGKKTLDPLTRRAGQPHLNSKQISELYVIKPPTHLQSDFAKRANLIEHQKSVAQKSLEKSEQLFNSLLQKAFKGELTLKDQKELISA
jgi:type I restriction enzyme, S subunit